MPMLLSRSAAITGEVTSPLDVTIESDTDASGAGDIIFKTDGGGEAARFVNGGSKLKFKSPAAGVTSGDGLFVTHDEPYAVAVANGQALSLLHLSTHNTDAVGGSDLYTISVVVDTDHLDTGAGLRIVNNGMSDCIYLGVKGKPGATASTPTGIGCDINRNGNVENSPANAGFGFQAWDWSQTDQGTNGPNCLVISKHLNPDTNHRAIKVIANRRAIFFEQPEGAGFDSTQPLLSVFGDVSGVTKWQLTANGDQVIANTRGIYLAGASGNQAFILIDAANHLTFRGGTTTTNFLSNDGTRTTFGIADSGNLQLFDGGNIVLGTGTGTKIGTAAAQKLGFYNKTPIVQPAGTPAAATDLASVILLANSLRTNLLALGLVA